MLKKLEGGSKHRVIYLHRAEFLVGQVNENVSAFKHPNFSEDYVTAVSDVFLKNKYEMCHKNLVFL